MGDCSLAKVNINHMHRAYHLIITGNQVGEVQLAFGERMLTVPDHLVLL